MAASSSATKMLPAGMGSSSGHAARLGVDEHGHQHSKHSVTRLRLALDDTAVIANNLGYQRQSEPTACRLRGHERIKQMRQQVLGNARTVILDAEFQRQRHTGCGSGQ